MSSYARDQGSPGGAGGVDEKWDKYRRGVGSEHEEMERCEFEEAKGREDWQVMGCDMLVR